MADVHDKETRSYNMSMIKSKDTKPEILVRKFLFSKGYRYKLHDKGLPGRPDIVLPKLRVVIFVHGCFWHGHENCPYFVLPQTQIYYWQEKIQGNKQRDYRNVNNLKDKGWEVFIIFECGLKALNKEKTYEKLLMLLKEQSQKLKC